MGREAMTDILKLTFNLLVHYPKVRHLTLTMGIADMDADGRL